MFTLYLPQVSLLLHSDRKWPKLLDANDVLRLSWAYRTLRYDDAPLMYLLQLRAMTQVGHFAAALMSGFEYFNRGLWTRAGLRHTARQCSKKHLSVFR
jgi:hypothetical protein